MRFLPAIVGLLPLVSAYYHDFPDTEFEPEPFHVVDLETASRPTIEQAAVQARRVVRREKIGTLSTVFQNGAPDGLEGSPIALMDYYADCSDDGSPALLGFKIAMNFRNVEQGSAISLSIRQHKPMGEFFSPAAHHRLSLIGKLEKVDADSDEAEELKKCYIRRHPDAKWWTPGNKIHDSYWVKFKVEKVYWIGGFGNVQQIGWIPLDLYQNVTLPGPHKPDDGDHPPPPPHDSPDHGDIPHHGPPHRGDHHHGPPFGYPPFGGRHQPFGHHAPPPSIHVTCNCGPPSGPHHPPPPPHGKPAPGHPSDDEDDDGHDGHHERRPGFRGPHDGPKPPKGPWSKPWGQPQEAVEL